MEKKLNIEELTNDELSFTFGGHHGVAYQLGELVGGVFGVCNRVADWFSKFV